MLRTIKNRDIFIALACFILGSICTYAYTNQSVKNVKVLTGKILDNCIGSLSASNDLINNCSDAYKVATTCASNINACDISSAAKQLEMLNRNKQIIESKIQNYSSQMDNIISSNK